MSRSKELMDDAFKSAEECGIEIRDKYAYASGYLTAIIKDLEQTNQKLRD